ncbi:conserved hypothetical protein [Paraburkholderia unamae]|nr:conserved hypothetical protein [Paraburkholderia unamae]
MDNRANSQRIECGRGVDVNGVTQWGANQGQKLLFEPPAVRTCFACGCADANWLIFFG